VCDFCAFLWRLFFKITDVFETKLQTYWDDADPAGQVFFVNFFKFMEHTETELFRAAGVERVRLYDQLGVWMPRVEAFAKFSKPIRTEASILIRMRTRFQRLKTVRMEFEVLDAEDGSFLAEGYVTAVCVDRKTGRSTTLPERIREIFARANDEQ